MADAASIAVIACLAVVCLASGCIALRMLIPDAQQRARLRSERIERLFRDESASEMAGAA